MVAGLCILHGIHQFCAFCVFCKRAMCAQRRSTNFPPTGLVFQHNHCSNSLMREPHHLISSHSHNKGSYMYQGSQASLAPTPVSWLVVRLSDSVCVCACVCACVCVSVWLQYLHLPFSQLGRPFVLQQSHPATICLSFTNVCRWPGHQSDDDEKDELCIRLYYHNGDGSGDAGSDCSGAAAYTVVVYQGGARQSRADLGGQ